VSGAGTAWRGASPCGLVPLRAPEPLAQTSSCLLVSGIPGLTVRQDPVVMRPLDDARPASCHTPCRSEDSSQELVIVRGSRPMPARLGGIDVPQPVSRRPIGRRDSWRVAGLRQPEFFVLDFAFKQGPVQDKALPGWAAGAMRLGACRAALCCGTFSSRSGAFMAWGGGGA